MSTSIIKVLTRPPAVLKVVTRKVTMKVQQRGARGPAADGGGVSAETVQSMINAEVGPTAPDPTLIFDQYLI